MVVARRDVCVVVRLLVEMMVEVGTRAVLVITVVALPQREVDVRKQAWNELVAWALRMRGTVTYSNAWRVCASFPVRGLQYTVRIGMGLWWSWSQSYVASVSRC
jgi:hypothetical protein